MGQCAYNPNTPVTKGVSGVLFLRITRENGRLPTACVAAAA